MIKYLLSKTNKNIPVKIILMLALLGSLPLTGSDCENNVLGGGTTGNIIGTWNLTHMAGYLQDVCEGEQVTFDTTGTATLQCPNMNPITRSYTVSNNVLTYTETSIQYDVTTLTNTTLVLTGKNIGRTLTYTKIPADGYSSYAPENTKKGFNSSEMKIDNKKGRGE